MPLEDHQVKRLIIDLLTAKSERDKQRTIGASQIGNPCDYCLASTLQGKHGQEYNHYWLGAKLGTAMHRELEHEEAKYTQGTEDYRFTALEGARIEESIVLGEIQGYGVLRSKPDLVLVSEGHLLDHKSTLKKKVAKYKLDGVPMQYVYQQQLYAWGLNKAGVKIERCSLVFVNRDGSGDSDIWIHSFEYDESLALRAWDRLESIWTWLQDGGDVDTLTSDPGCYVCNVLTSRGH